MTTIASVVRCNGTTRLVLRRSGRRQALQRAVDVLRDLRAAGGDEFLPTLAEYLTKIGERYGPPVKVRPGGSGRERQLPTGDQ